jgi:twitching motility protein PilU
MHLYDLFKEGRITLDEALRNADSANNLRLRIKLAEDEGFTHQSTGNAFKPNDSEKPKEEDLTLRLDNT